MFNTNFEATLGKSWKLFFWKLRKDSEKFGILFLNSGNPEYLLNKTKVLNQLLRIQNTFTINPKVSGDYFRI